MATHALIGRQEADGKVRYVWVKQDGGLARVGLTLHRHYGTPESLDPILALGDLMALGAGPGRRHDRPPSGAGPAWRRWSAAHGHETTAFHRDCGRPLRAARHAADAASFPDADSNEYAYLQRDGAWTVSEYGGPFGPLADALVARGYAEEVDATPQPMDEIDAEAVEGLSTGP